MSTTTTASTVKAAAPTPNIANYEGKYVAKSSAHTWIEYVKGGKTWDPGTTGISYQTFSGIKPADMLISLYDDNIANWPHGGDFNYYKKVYGHFPGEIAAAAVPATPVGTSVAHAATGTNVTNSAITTAAPVAHQVAAAAAAPAPKTAATPAPKASPAPATATSAHAATLPSAAPIAAQTKAAAIPAAPAKSNLTLDLNTGNTTPAAPDNTAWYVVIVLAIITAIFFFIHKHN